jgi:hypothetical protein
MIGLGDRCNLKVARRLRQGTAVQRGTSNERNVGLDQENALHVRSSHNLDIARDLPEDVLRLCAVLQDHILARILLQVPSNLNDEDGIGIVSSIAVRGVESDATGEEDTCAEGVDTGRQHLVGEGAGSEIFPRGIGVRAPRGVRVSALHVADDGDQMRWSGRAVARRVGLAIVLTISFLDLIISVRGILSTRVHGQKGAEASNGVPGDGVDGDVACDGGLRHGGDASLGKDREVFGISKVDLGFDKLALSTSDGLGICRKRDEGEENKAASVGKEHRGLEYVRKRERVKLH